MFKDALAAAQKEADRTGKPCLIKRTRSRKFRFAIRDGRYGVTRVRLVMPEGGKI